MKMVVTRAVQLQSGAWMFYHGQGDKDYSYVIGETLADCMKTYRAAFKEEGVDVEFFEGIRNIEEKSDE